MNRETLGSSWPIRVVSATGNRHKLAELTRLLDGHVALEAKAQSLGDVCEDGDTFTENALIKARFVNDATSRPALADDSGLVVDALDGAPGLYSARYAGVGASDADNRIKLLQALEQVDAAMRTARFVCAFALVSKEVTLTVQGVCEGVITEGELGENGFGYDPIFVPHGANGQTFAQMSSQDKEKFSHRARACEALIRALDDIVNT